MLASPETVCELQNAINDYAKNPTSDAASVLKKDVMLLLMLPEDTGSPAHPGQTHPPPPSLTAADLNCEGLMRCLLRVSSPS